MTEEVRYWQVAVDAPLKEALTYKSTDSEYRIGQSVLVPLGRRKARGIIVSSIKKEELNFDAKLTKELVTQGEFPPITSQKIQWLEWVSKYYSYPLGQVCQLIFPPLDKKSQRKSKRPPVIREMEQTQPPEMTDEQTKCVHDILQEPRFSVHLLYGVTGSGKTEVYMRLIDQQIKNGKQALLLVPEISLTPQLVQRFAQRFGDQVAVLHSQLTDRERTNQWWEIVNKEKKILIGARSALFCPIEDLGIIVVDEEHEASYKQDEKLKYHGRDCAVMLAKTLNIPVVLGSATPSLETWSNTLQGKFKLHHLKQRVFKQSFPIVEVVDMKLEKENQKGLPSWLSEKLFEKMTETLDNKHQVALLLNRRGLAQVVMCKSCGHTSKCPNCEISLTLHQGHHLVCHYCDYNENYKEDCPQCSEGSLEPLGIGTEQVEKDLQMIFPGKKIARADRDEINSRFELEELIQDMEDGKTDILVGTQMIAKGLDFKNLYLVGFVLADVGFNLPDFRATERSFQLLTQMSGRAGRHVFPNGSTGEVIIQAFNTEHSCLKHVCHHDFAGFAKEELHERKALSYPPYSKLVCLRLQGPVLADVEKTGERLALRGQLLQQKNSAFATIQVLGPAASPLSKLRGNYRMQVLIKNENSPLLHSFLKGLLHEQSWVLPKVKILIDVDPLHLL